METSVSKRNPKELEGNLKQGNDDAKINMNDELFEVVSVKEEPPYCDGGNNCSTESEQVEEEQLINPIYIKEEAPFHSVINEEKTESAGLHSVSEVEVKEEEEIFIKEESFELGEAETVTENGASLQSVPDSMQSQAQKRTKTRLHRPCPYCSKYIKRFSEHLWNKHRDEEEMKKIDSTANPTERKKLFYHLRVSGIRRENEKKKGNEKLLRLKKDTKKDDGKQKLSYQCDGCSMIYSRKAISNHKRVCSFSQTKPNRGKGVIESLPFNGKINESLNFIDKQFLSKVIEPMNQTNLKTEIMSDIELLYIGNFLFSKHISNKEIMSTETARKKLRYLAKIKISFNNAPDRRGKEKLMISEILSFSNWFELRKLLKDMIYITHTNEIILKRGTASQIKYAIQHGIDALIGLYSSTPGEEAENFVQKLTKFKEAYFKLRDSLFGKITVADNERRAENRVAEKVPSSEQVSLVLEECNKVLQAAGTLQIFSEAQFVKLRRAAVTKLIFFNGRRPSEISLLKIRQWELAKKNCCLPPDQEKFLNDQIGYNLLEDFKIIMTLRKRIEVPVVVPKSCFKALNILADPAVRTRARVSMDGSNSFLFPSARKSENPCSGSDCVDQFLKEVLPTKDLKFSSVQVRHLLANKFGTADYPAEAREWVCKFFRHSETVNELSHQCPNVRNVLNNIAPALDRIEKGFSETEPDLTDECWNDENNVQSSEFESHELHQNADSPEGLSAPSVYKAMPKKSEVLQFHEGNSAGLVFSNLSSAADLSMDDESDIGEAKPKAGGRERWSPEDTGLISDQFKDFILGGSYPNPDLTDECWNDENYVQSSEFESHELHQNADSPEEGLSAPSVYKAMPKKSEVLQFHEGNSAGLVFSNLSSAADLSTDDERDIEETKPKAGGRERWSPEDTGLISDQFKDFILGGSYPTKERITSFLRSHPDILSQHKDSTKIWKMRIKLNNTKLLWMKSQVNAKKRMQLF